MKYIVLILIITISIQAVGNNKEKIIYEFMKNEEIKSWLIVNDGVMGGLSQSAMFLTDQSTAIFKGNISLENNGGFSSVRTLSRSYDLEGFDGILLRIKGDGQTYQFRLRKSNNFDGVSYRYVFPTESNVWKTIKIPFNEGIPVFRGFRVKNQQAILGEDVKQMGILFTNKREVEFEMEIDWIKAYKE